MCHPIPEIGNRPAPVFPAPLSLRVSEGIGRGGRVLSARPFGVACGRSMKRRKFLTSATVGLSAVGFPRLMLAQKTETAKAVIGQDGFKYECDHEWGKLPDGHNYGGASHGVAFDSQGLIYISHQGGPGGVFVFDRG